jgi:hypothetical protein
VQAADAGAGLNGTAVERPATARRFTRVEPGNRTGPAALSILLHVGLVLVALNVDLRAAAPGAGTSLAPEPITIVEWVHDREVRSEAPSQIDVRQLPSASLASKLPHRVELSNQTLAKAIEPPSKIDELPGGGIVQPLEPQPIQPEEIASAAVALEQAPDALSQTSTMPVRGTVRVERAEQAMLMQRVAQIARSLGKNGHTELTWQQDGRPYRAVLSGEAGSDDMDLDRVRADITTLSRNGKNLRTQMTLKRLAFSQFTQVIDHWDPEVELHDDEIVGRFHSNSTFRVSSDAKVAPRISGMATTTAGDVVFSSSPSIQRRDQTFKGGFEARAMRVSLPDRAVRLDRETLDSSAHVRRFDYDAHITLYSDGHYTWEVPGARVSSRDDYPADRVTYFIATPRATLYLKGTVNGRVIVYAPRHIVIEGDLRYAADPRVIAAADDYLGVVSDEDVEIARPAVIGPGDLHIEAAIFARRNFVIQDFESPRAGTLSIYGSLTSGTMTASEPRYATRIEFDPRLSQVQLPGFPATNQYDVDRWNAEWDELPVAGLQ